MRKLKLLCVVAVSTWGLGCLPTGSLDSNGSEPVEDEGGQTTGGSDGGSGGGGPQGGGGPESDGGGDNGGGDGGEEAQGCAANELECEGACEDVSESAQRCGACGNACGAGAACSGGACACDGGLEWCGAGDCVDLSSSSSDCGACGESCAGSEQCVEGSCVNLSVVERVLLLTNQARASAQSCGGQPYPAVGPLEAHPSLAQSAQAHAVDMSTNGYFDHDSQDGTTASQRMRAAGYTGNRTGENIAAGQATPEGVVGGWMESPGHCRNIMNGGYRYLGVGYSQGGSYRHYWVQNFGG